MNGPDLDTQVRELVGNECIRLGWHPRLDVPPASLPVGDADLALRVEGMMLGLAIGDALGKTSESMNPDARRRRHGARAA